MKKILTLSLILIFSLAFSQGKLFIQNYSNYDLVMRVVAGSPTNCHPEAIGSLTFPANTQSLINNFNDAGAYTTGFSVLLSPNANSTFQTIPSGLLTAISPLTQWKFAWFHTRYPGTTNMTPDIDFNMGDSAFPSCPWSPSSLYTAGTLTQAFWFYVASENTTYLVVQ